MDIVKIDTHVHLLLNKNVKLPNWGLVRNCIKVAKARGLYGFCVTEHVESQAYSDLIHGLFDKNVLGGDMTSKRLVVDGVAIFPGAEVQLSNGCNIGVHCCYDVLKDLNRIPGYYSLDALKSVLDESGEPHKLVLHHMFWPGKQYDKPLEAARVVDAIEIPAKHWRECARYIEFAEVVNLPSTGGSDAHSYAQIGIAYTQFVNVCSSDVDVLELLDGKLHSGVIEPEVNVIMEIAKINRSELLGAME